MELTLLEKAVLAALMRGVDSLSGLKKLVNVDEEALRRAIERLESLGLVKRERRGLILKREVLVLTEKGFEEARRALEELEAVARRVEARLAKHEEGRVTASQVASELGDLAYIVPLLAWLGLIDLAMLAPLTLAAQEGYEDLSGGEPGDYDVEDAGDLGGDVEAV